MENSLVVFERKTRQDRRFSDTTRYKGQYLKYYMVINIKTHIEREIFSFRSFILSQEKKYEIIFEKSVCSYYLAIKV